MFATQLDVMQLLPYLGLAIMFGLGVVAGQQR